MKPQAWHVRCRLALATLTCSALLACGGGGGGGETPGGGGVQASGLLPAAPGIGATLEQDATVLRPMRTGAVAQFRGRIVGGSAWDQHTSTVTTRQEGGRWIEAATNLMGQGPDEGDPVTVAGGRVTVSSTMDWVDGGRRDAVELVMLASPVRQGERHVAFDQRIADVGQDLDGDTVSDGLDAAVWTQVAGEETLDLPQRAGLRTVRVDVEIRLRARYSRDGSTSEVIRATASEWYAPGLGLVQRRTDTASAVDNALREVVEEVLVTLDAGVSGLGYTQPTALSAGGGSSVDGQALGRPIDAVAFADHVVVATTIPGQASGAGVALTRIDPRGEVVKTTLHTAQALFGTPTGMPGVTLAVGPQGLLMLTSGSGGVQLFRMDADGQNRLDATATSLVGGPIEAAGDERFSRAAVSGDTLWLTWVARDGVDGQGDTLFTQFLRAFDTQGTPRGPALRVVSSTNPLEWYGRRLDVVAGTGVLVFGSAQPGAGLWRLAHALPTDTVLPALRTLSPLQASGTGCPEAASYGGRMQTLAVGGAARLLCLTEPTAGGLAALDAQWSPARDGAGRLVSTSLLGSDWRYSGELLLTGNDDRDLLLGSTQNTLAWSWDSAETSHYRLAQLPLQGVADSDHLKTLVRWPSELIYPERLLMLSDRVLVLGMPGGQPDRLGSMVVWR